MSKNRFSMKRKIIFSFITIMLLIAFSYAVAISNLPDNIVLLQGEKIENNNLLGLNFVTQEASSSLNEKLQEGEVTGTTGAKVVAFGKIPLKEVDITVIPKTKVVPLGNTIGVKLYTNRSISNW